MIDKEKIENMKTEQELMYFYQNEMKILQKEFSELSDCVFKQLTKIYKKQVFVPQTIVHNCRTCGKKTYCFNQVALWNNYCPNWVPEINIGTITCSPQINCTHSDLINSVHSPVPYYNVSPNSEEKNNGINSNGKTE